MLITNLLPTPAKLQPPLSENASTVAFVLYASASHADQASVSGSPQLENVRQQLAFPHVQLIDLWPRRDTDRLCLFSRNLSLSLGDPLLHLGAAPALGVIELVDPDPRKELRRRPQIFLAGTAPY